MNSKEIDAPPTNDQIVEIVLASNILGRSANQKQLFEYLMLHDPNVTPSEYEIASIVFKRYDDFDPAIDSVVRTEMFRLRRNLERFNANANSFKINIPPRSFLPVVQAIDDPVQSKIQFPLVFLGAGIIAIVFASLVFWNVKLATTNNTTKKTVIDETFRQKISVVASNASNDPLTDNLLEQLVTQFSHDISAHNTVWLVKPDEKSDYRMEFKSEKITSNSDSEIFIFVYSTAGNLIYSKPYKFPANPTTQSITKLSQRIYVESFDLKGPVVRYHANNPNIDPVRRYLYRCALDALTFTVEGAPNYHGPNHLTCLDPSLTNVPNDKGFIYVLQADMFAHIELGNLDIPIENPTMHAKEALKLAEEHSYFHPNYFNQKIKVTLLGNPIDRQELRKVTDDYYSFYSDTDIANYLVAEIESKYFGNWDRARQLAFKALGDMSEEINLAQIVLFNHAIVTRNWVEAEKRYKLTPKYAGIRVLIPVAHLACKTNNHKLIDELRGQFSDYKINSWDEIIAYVKDRQYHSTYENSLIDDQVIKSCGLF